MMWYFILFVVLNDVLVVLLVTLGIRIFLGRPVNMQELQALQAAITQLSSDVQLLAGSGLISGAALAPLTATIQSLDAQVKALIPV